MDSKTTIVVLADQFAQKCVELDIARSEHARALAEAGAALHERGRDLSAARQRIVELENRLAEHTSDEFVTQPDPLTPEPLET